VLGTTLFVGFTLGNNRCKRMAFLSFLGSFLVYTNFTSL